ncbi:MAG: GTP-binding protein [Acidobacteriota bacterium]
MSSVDVFANIRHTTSREALDFLDQLLRLVPEELKYGLKQVIDSLPAEGDNMHKVLELVRVQWKDIRSEDSVKIAIVGTARTGKASLMQSFVRKQVAPAMPIFTVVDVQGLEEFLGFGRDQIPRELEHADVILLVLDARYGINDSTVEMYKRLQSLGKQLLVILNKMDLVESRPGDTIRQARQTLKTNVFSASIVQPESVDTILKAIVAANSKALYPLIQNFPAFRRTICNGIVTQSAFASGLVGAVKIPVSDLLPLTAIQTAMILKTARAFGFALNRERIRELLPAFLIGLGVREATHRLRLRFPDQRKLIAVVAGGVWTFVLGNAAIRYFESISDLFHTQEARKFG